MHPDELDRDLRKSLRRGRFNTLPERLQILYHTDPHVRACVKRYVDGEAGILDALTTLVVLLADAKALFAAELLRVHEHGLPPIILDARHQAQAQAQEGGQAREGAEGAAPFADDDIPF